ncbi:hypothetical protein CIHG_04807 [Coccidioides immitis H538.4]|uniref:Uncharacterized protein n=1 Tax=Coccidioides immitis H538.4 TaxID=396776 RepID=A0A0J8RPW3_COCIT|nr:hypothetical protein CIHG_04807 [Coccidioides immitis H538.4]
MPPQRVKSRNSNPGCHENPKGREGKGDMSHAATMPMVLQQHNALPLWEVKNVSAGRLRLRMLEIYGGEHAIKAVAASRIYFGR